MSPDKYNIGQCSKCNQTTGLLYGICAQCMSKSENDLPDFMKDIFGKESKNDD